MFAPSTCEKTSTLFSHKLTIKRREWREMAQQSLHCFPSQRFSRRSSPLPAGSPWVPRLLGGCSAPRASDAPSPSSTPSLRSPTWNLLVKTATFPQKKIQFGWSTIFQIHVKIIQIHSPCSSNTEKLSNRIGNQNQLILFSLFELKEMQNVNNQLN